jgi:hypothetical protein
MQPEPRGPTRRSEGWVVWPTQPRCTPVDDLIMTLNQRTTRRSPGRCRHASTNETRIAGLRRTLCNACGQITLVNLSDAAAANRAQAAADAVA